MPNENPFGKLYEECLSVSKATDFPLIVDVELTNFCNMNCKFCPTGEGTSKRKKGFMLESTWYAVLSELVERKTAVRFVGWGEPTLHPRLRDWIVMAKELKALTHFTTNDVKGVQLQWYGADSYKISKHEHYDLTVPPKEYLPCPKVLSMLTVQWDGSVTACQGDYDGVMVLGNIQKNSLAFFWKCGIMQNYRKMLSEMRHSEMPLCKNCARKEGK